MHVDSKPQRGASAAAAVGSVNKKQSAASFAPPPPAIVRQQAVGLRFRRTGPVLARTLRATPSPLLSRRPPAAHLLASGRLSSRAAARRAEAEDKKHTEAALVIQARRSRQPIAAMRSAPVLQRVRAPTAAQFSQSHAQPVLVPLPPPHSARCAACWANAPPLPDEESSWMQNLPPWPRRQRPPPRARCWPSRRACSGSSTPTAMPLGSTALCSSCCVAWRPGCQRAAATFPSASTKVRPTGGPPVAVAPCSHLAPTALRKLMALPCGIPPPSDHGHLACAGRVARCADGTRAAAARLYKRGHDPCHNHVERPARAYGRRALAVGLWCETRRPRVPQSPCCPTQRQAAPLFLFVRRSGAWVPMLTLRPGPRCRCQRSQTARASALQPEHPSPELRAGPDDQSRGAASEWRQRGAAVENCASCSFLPRSHSLKLSRSPWLVTEMAATVCGVPQAAMQPIGAGGGHGHPAALLHRAAVGRPRVRSLHQRARRHPRPCAPRARKGVPVLRQSAGNKGWRRWPHVAAAVRKGEQGARLAGNGTRVPLHGCRRSSPPLAVCLARPLQHR